MKRVGLISVIIVGVIAVVAVLLILKKPDKQKIAPIQITKPTRGTITRSVIATGEIRPLAIADVKSKIGGVVRRFFVDEGETVKKGQKLAEIVPTASPNELVAAREKLEILRLELELSEKNLREAERLTEKNLASEKQIDQARTQVGINRARYEAALSELRILEQSAFISTGSSPMTKGIDEDMTIVSPIDGIVLSRNVDEGSSVIPISSAYGGTSIVTLADISTMHLEGEVDESDVGKIHLAMPARIHVDAFPDTVFEGILTRISPAAVEREGLVNFRVKVEIIGETSNLKTGMSADAELIVEERSNILTLPEAAIVYEAESTFVEVYDERKGQKQRVKVKTGISDGIRTEIIEGVDESSNVIIQ
ncbi:MAG: efflux RND transporter periplasmic adaptor subunit [bacterium]